MNPINPIRDTQALAELTKTNLPKPTDSVKNTPEFRLLLDSMMNQLNEKQAAAQAKQTPQLNIINTPINQPVIAQNISNSIQFDPNENNAIDNRKKRKSPSDTLMQELDLENALSVTPFQYFSETAVNALKEISDQEFQVNKLMQEYIDGKVSIEEVSIETTKLNLAISFASTVISTASQTFKELISMQI